MVKGHNLFQKREMVNIKKERKFLSAGYEYPSLIFISLSLTDCKKERKKELLMNIKYWTTFNNNVKLKGTRAREKKGKQKWWKKCDDEQKPTIV